jgi:integrase
MQRNELANAAQAAVGGREYVDSQALDLAELGKADALVFTDQRGGVLRNSNWRAGVFQPAVEKCQETDDSFPSITPHDLRHTAASLAISAGANVKAVQRMLGLRQG